MKEIAAVAYYEILRLLRHRTVMVVLFVMPLMVIYILGTALSAFFADQPLEPNSLRLALLMKDDGFIGPSLDRLLGSGELGEVEVLRASGMEELRGMLDRGAADAGLAVPSGFSDGLRRGEKPVWELLTGKDDLKSAMALQELHAFFDGWNQRFAESGSWRDGTVPFEGATPRGSGLAGESEGIKFTGWNGLEVSYSAIQYYSAHMLIMFMLYGGMAAAMNLVIAKEDHTLMRIRSLPVPAWRVLAGHVAGQSLVLAAQTAVIIGGTAALFGVDWGRSFGLLALVCFLVLVFVMSLAVIAGLLARRRQEVSVMFQMGTVLMTFLAGGYTPSIGDTLSRLGTYTMNYWGVQSLLRMMLHGDAGDVAGYVRVLAWLAAGAALAAAAVYRKAGYHE